MFDKEDNNPADPDQQPWDDAPVGRATSRVDRELIINRLLAIWLANPQLRLSQLIINCFEGDFYHTEDFNFIETIESFYSPKEESNG